MHSISKKSEKTYVIMELQRKRNAVVQLQKKLNSYQYEPKTSCLFKKIAELKAELNSLNANAEQLLTVLQVNDIVIVDYIDVVEQQFAHFNELHSEIEDYIKTFK